MIRTLSLLAISCIFFLLSSCDGDKTEESPWKHNDNTLRVRHPSAIRTMNPYFATVRYEADVHKLVFQELMEFDYQSQELTPMLLKSQPVIEKITEGEFQGGLKLTYDILDEAVWDDGKPITGYDLLFSMKTVFNPKLPTQNIVGYFDNVVDVEVDEGNPKKFTVFTNNSYLLSLPGISNFTIIPEHIYDPAGLSKAISFKELRNPANAKKMEEDENIAQFAASFSDPKFAKEIVVGSGPYKLVEWEEGQRVVLAKKQNWWGEKLEDKNIHLVAHPDTIIFYPIADQAATITALKDESIDVAAEVDAQQFVDLRDNEFTKPLLGFYTPPTYMYFMTIMNNRNPKLSDKRVRRALAHVIDMDLVINELYNGLAERMIGPVFPSKKYFDKSLQPIEFNLEKARQLLKEAGWEDSNGNGTVDKAIDGQLTEMSLSYQYVPTSNFSDNFSELFKNNAQKVGIEINREALEFKVARQNGSDGNFELGIRATSWYPLPDDFKQLWHTDAIGTSRGNFPRFGNAESDALIDAIRYNENEQERNAQYVAFQKIVYDEQPVIFQIIPLNRIAAHKRFEPAIGQLGISPQHFKLKEEN